MAMAQGPRYNKHLVYEKRTGFCNLIFNLREAHSHDYSETYLARFVPSFCYYKPYPLAKSQLHSVSW